MLRRTSASELESKVMKTNKIITVHEDEAQRSTSYIPKTTLLPTLMTPTPQALLALLALAEVVRVAMHPIRVTVPSAVPDHTQAGVMDPKTQADLLPVG